VAPEAAATDPAVPAPAEPAFPVVLVTGAGGAAGVCVIRALAARGVRVVAADADDMAVGLQLADEAGLVPRADDPRFLESVCELARTTGAGALISTVPGEVPVLAEGRAELAAAGLATWLPGPDAGRASLDTGDRPDGLEFTIDALLDRDGALLGAVPRWRLETAAGVSTKGRTFEDPLLVEQAEALLAAGRLEGPVTIRGLLLSASGLYSFTEVQPTFSGGLSLSLAAGADLVGEYLRGILGLPVRRENLAYEPGVTMERYYEDVILRPPRPAARHARMEAGT
jgi:carbamoyl-phosphate synthase large subunit